MNDKYILPPPARYKYWRKVIKLLAKQGWLTLDGKPLHWQTVERLAAARGFSAVIIVKPENMADVINRLLPPMNF